MMEPSICNVHSKVVEFYCSNHGKTICSNCAVFEHKQCNIITLDSNTDSKYTNSESKEILKNMSDLKSRIETFIQTLENEQKEQRVNIVQESELMRSKLKELETVLLSDLDRVCENQTDVSRRHLARCVELLAMLQRDNISNGADEFIQFLNSDLSKMFLSFGPGRNTLVVEFNQRLKQSVDQATSLGHVIVNNSVQVKGNSQLPSDRFNMPAGPMDKHLEALQSCQATYSPQYAGYSTASLDQPPPPSYEQVLEKPIGNLPVNQADIIGIPVYDDQYAKSVSPVYGSQYPQSASQAYDGQYPLSPNRREEPQTASNMRQHFSSVKSEFVVHFKAKTVEEKSFCCCSGVCFLKDGTIAIADNKHRKIKLFSVSLQLIAEAFLGCTIKPFDITQLDNGEIAVTCPKDMNIYFFDIKCQQIDSLNTSQPCRGITSANRMMYVFCESTHEFDDCVRIYNLDKQLMKTISRDQNGITIMNQASYIAICPVRDSIYYVKGAVGKCTIRCIDHNGSQRWKSKVKSWSDVPRGLAAIGGGVLVVCDSVIYYISQNGTHWDMLLESPNAIRAIAVNEDRSMLLVTYYAYDCTADQVSIYRLVYH